MIKPITFYAVVGYRNEWSGEVLYISRFGKAHANAVRKGYAEPHKFKVSKFVEVTK